MKRWVGLLLLLVFLVVAAACGGGDGAEPTATSATQAEAIDTAEAPDPTATPLGGAVPEGWQRHATASFQVDLPDTWEVYDFAETFSEMEPETEELLETLLSASGLTRSQFESEMEETEFAAVDPESSGFNLFGVGRQDFPSPVTVGEIISSVENEAADAGLTVLATESALTIGGLRAGRWDILYPAVPGSSSQSRGVQYIVMPDPYVQFILDYNLEADDYDVLNPVFEQIAQSFRVLGSP